MEGVDQYYVRMKADGYTMDFADSVINLGVMLNVEERRRNEEPPPLYGFEDADFDGAFIDAAKRYATDLFDRHRKAVETRLTELNKDKPLATPDTSKQMARQIVPDPTFQ